VAPVNLRAPIQLRAQRTRAALLEAAEREFAERGYAQATARSIAERAGVATGSFYQYFADKDAALRELAQARFGQLAARISALDTSKGTAGDVAQPARARASVHAIVAEVLAYHRCDRGLHAVLAERRLTDPELDAITDAAERRFVRDVEQRLAHWGCGGDLKAQAFMIFGLIEGAIHSHVLGTRMISDRRFVDALTESVLTLVRAGIAGATARPSAMPERRGETP
jgi:AcrR family transcriptional regulator